MLPIARLFGEKRRLQATQSLCEEREKLFMARLFQEKCKFQTTQNLLNCTLIRLSRQAFLKMDSFVQSSSLQNVIPRRSTNLSRHRGAEAWAGR